MRVFYVVYPPPCLATQCLDVVRVLMSPTAKARAHITVRGPYDALQDPRSWDADLRGAAVKVGGVGTFWGPTQHTVYLDVAADGLRPLWHKPDYPAFTPHVALYDGTSRAVATRVRDMLRNDPIELTFRADRLGVIAKTDVPAPPLCESLDTTLVDAALGCAVPLGVLDALSEAGRLVLVEEVWHACSSALRG